jgi:phosphopantothenoylcysteine decarboxylase/phosphopantothenate--cysteine ligase
LLELLPQPHQTQHPQGVRRGCKGLKPQQHTQHGLGDFAGEHLEGDELADGECIVGNIGAVHHSAGTATKQAISITPQLSCKMLGIMEQTQTKSTVQPKRIVLGLTGGIAAYKAAELARLLVKQGIEVQAAMTEAACHFITPATMQALTGRPVLVNQWDVAAQSGSKSDGMAHISASRAADAIVIAPATADFIAKLALGLADDLLSTLCLARDCPLMVAPAMNRQMWSNAATQRNLAQLERDGVLLLGPASGAQACGEEGMGRMLEAEDLTRDIVSLLGGIEPPATGVAMLNDTAIAPGQRLDGVKVLITAGPTYEPIDTVRGITNRSSGKMGYAVAQAALELGAEVTLVSGPVALARPQGAALVPVTSAEEMFDAVKQRAGQADIFIGVAAVADYRVATPSVQKIKKSDGPLKLELVPNPDILAYVASLPKPPFCVGFAAESEKLHENATAKRRAKKIPLLAANLAHQAIGSDDNELVLFDDAGEHVLPRADKLTLARQLMRHIANLRGGPRQ